jgi:D-alanyl-D-alanine carboxypeptidase
MEFRRNALRDPAHQVSTLLKASSLVPATLLVLSLCETAASGAATPASAATTQDITAAVRADLATYLNERGKIEHISVTSASISLPDRRTIDAVAGTTSYGGTTAATTASLFQTGSNTKAFTAVLAVKLEADGKLSVEDTVGKWLPQYAPWKRITMHRLLDMTSGIATYDGTRAWERAVVATPQRFFSPADLIAFVDPKAPLHPGWLYSNTGYELTQLMVEKAAGSSYTDMIRSRVIAPAGLHSTYYYPNVYPAALRRRTVEGYYYDTSSNAGDLAPLAGKNVRDFSLSWTQAAGGIVMTPHDLALWARQLYQGSIVTPDQRAELQTLVSTKTALPIANPSESDPRGFGLGVTEVYRPGLGRFWFYEGETLGYRMVHAYFPAKDVVIAIGLNSQAAASEDHIGQLVETIYKTLETDGAI